MKTLLVRSFLFFAVIALFIAANSISTNSSHFGDNNSVPPSIAKYVTPYGTGNHSGSGWDNAYSLNDMKSKLTSNTTTTEKPLLQVYDSYIAGGKGIGITQNADPLFFPFYSDVQNCTIVDLDPDRRPLRIEYWDGGTPGEIKNILFLSPADYDTLICPVGEYNTIEGDVTYSGTNKWKVGDDFFDFCVNHGLTYFQD